MDSIIKLLEETAGSFWKISKENGKGESKVVFDYQGENKADSTDKFREIISHLTPGKYTVGVRTEAHKNNAQTYLDFEIPKMSNFQNSQPTGGVISQAEREKIYAQAYQDALQKITLEMKVEALEKEVATLRGEIAKLWKTFDEYTDDDESNDETALERIQKGAETFKGIRDLIKAA